MIKICFGDKYDDVSYGKKQNILYGQVTASALLLQLPAHIDIRLYKAYSAGMLNVS